MITGMVLVPGLSMTGCKLIDQTTFAPAPEARAVPVTLPGDRPAGAAGIRPATISRTRIMRCSRCRYAAEGAQRGGGER